MGGDQRDFSSFKDLRRALGGGEDEPEDEAASEAAPAPSGEDDGFEARPGLRELIASAGEAFGPMDTGPPCYRVVDSEEMELLASFRIRTVFPDAVLEEVRRLPRDPDPADFAGRWDLREERIFTIDGEDAKDYDDAISIKPLEGGGHELGVHIADVSHYVRPGTALDREALTRATSVYVADQVIPMLPEELSNNLCSLVPDRDRLAFSVYVEFDSRGSPGAFRFGKSVIRSKKRCTYRVVQKVLDGVDDEETRPLEFLKEDLGHFSRWTRQQQSIRDRKGSLRMQTPERKFEFDAKHEPVRIFPSALYFSQTLIEETALAINQAVGNFFRGRGLPTIYRIHPKKDQEEIDQVVEALGKYGIRVPDKDHLTGRDVGRLIRVARRRPNGEALIGRIMGLVERAEYRVADAEEGAEHWGLAREYYLHFTSPIRRYPDLVVHRWLHDVLTEGAAAETRLKQPEELIDLFDAAANSSAQADLAAMVETAIEDLKICQYMHRFEGEAVTARIRTVSPWGMEVDLVDHYVTGFLPARAMEGRKKVDGPVLTVVSRRGSRVFREGESIDVIVKRVDFVRLEVLLELSDKRR